MSHQRLAWVARAAIVIVLVLGALYWFSHFSRSASVARLVCWVLFTVPWFIGLLLPSTRIEYAAALVTGGSWVVVALLLIIGAFSPFSRRSGSVEWVLATAFGAGNLIVLVAAFLKRRERKMDIWMLLIAGIAAGFYEISVIRWAAGFFS